LVSIVFALQGGLLGVVAGSGLLRDLHRNWCMVDVPLVAKIGLAESGHW